VPAPTPGGGTEAAGDENETGLVSKTHEPTKFFKRKQLFVEMDELRGDQWRETHRWNFGLEEDLDEDGEPVWNHPHLPWISVFGLSELLEELGEESVMLDVEARSFDELVDAVIAMLVRCAFFGWKLHSRSAIDFHAFALLKALPCVCPMAFLSGVQSSYNNNKCSCSCSKMKYTRTKQKERRRRKGSSYRLTL
jgi:hypothetical protein